MLEDSQVNLVLTQEKFKDKIVTLISSARSNIEILSLDKQWLKIHNAVTELTAKRINLLSSVRPNNLAYVIYTSGSTGQPKGVMVEHQALMNRTYWMQTTYSLHEEDVVLQKTPYSFDVSVWEFVWPMMSGASLVFAEPDGHKDVIYLESLINKNKVTTLHFVPSMLHSFLASTQSDCKSVRQVFCSGEALGKSAVEQYKRKFPNASLYNLYGPTEAAIDVTAFECIESNSTSVPIGFPIANTQIYILDSYSNPVAVGVPGELHIAGDGLARGYLNRAELTLEKFVDNPFEPNTRMYKSGDLARWLEDGTIEYLGRIDTQVKIRGFRIELGEIEAQLNELSGIKDSVVVAKGEEANKQLIAFYLIDETASYLVAKEIREHLQQSLPEFMIPQVFLPIEVIPLTSSGKINRRALELIEVSFESKEKYQAPSNKTEKQLVDIWAQVLKLDTENIGVNANFFELGGHSLSAVQLLAKINNKFNQSLPLSILFMAPSISALTLLILNENTCKLNILVPIQTKGNERPIFAIPGVGGNVLSLQPLSHTFGDEQPFYGIQAVGFYGKIPPLDSVVKTAKANITALQSVQPNGPYRLLGHSYGGVVAYEMANILQESGEKIEFLVMLDTIAPQIRNKKRKENSDDVTDLFEICEEVANLHGVPLNLDIEELEQLSAKARKEYVVDKLKEYELEINIEQFNTFYNIYKANDLCYQTYNPIPLSKSINSLLFRAETNGLDITALPKDYGWGKMFTNQTHTFDIKAGHFSMLEIDHNQDIVKEINHMIKS